FGASGRNGGQIVHSYSRDLDVAEKQVGPRQARLLGEMAVEGGRIIRDRVRRYATDCDLKDGGVFAAVYHRQHKALEEQQALWRRYGYDRVELLDASGIRGVVN